MAEHILIVLVSGSKNDQLHIIRTDLVHHALDQVQTFLVRESWDDTDHELLIVLRETKLFLKRAFIFHFLFSEIFRVVILNDIRIRLRVEDIIVDTVYNPTEIAGSRPHKSVKPFSVERGLDLLCVGVADRRDRVGIHKTALQHISVFVCL